MEKIYKNLYRLAAKYTVDILAQVFTWVLPMYILESRLLAVGTFEHAARYQAPSQTDAHAHAMHAMHAIIRGPYMHTN